MRAAHVSNAVECIQEISKCEVDLAFEKHGAEMSGKKFSGICAESLMAMM